MSKTLKRLSADWVEASGHPVLFIETFVDPSRHLGTCYGASSFLYLGATEGYGRRSGRYVAHGQIKHVYLRALHRLSIEVLAGTFDHPLLLPNPRSQMAQIDFNTADLTSLIERIETITDPRDPRGIRHDAGADRVCNLGWPQEPRRTEEMVRELVPGGPRPPRRSDLPIDRAPGPAELCDDPQGGDGSRC